MTIADLLVGKSVKLLRQRRDGFGDDFHLFAVQGELACLCHKRVACRLNDITHLKEFFDDSIIIPFSQFITVIIDLYQALAVLDLGKGCLSHDADKFDTTCERHDHTVVFFLFGVLQSNRGKCLQKLA